MTLKCPKCGSTELEWVEDWSRCHFSYPIKVSNGRSIADMSLEHMNWGWDSSDDIESTYIRCRKCNTKIEGYDRDGVDEIVRSTRR